MALICDTGGVLALYDASNAVHAPTPFSHDHAP